MKKLVCSLVIAFIAIILLVVSFYFYSTTPVDKKNNKEIVFVVKKGSGKKEIIKDLKDANLIRSKLSAYVYVVLHNDIIFKSGTFTVKRDMSLGEIFNTLDSGKSLEQAGINVTLKEGKRYTDYIEILSKTLDIKEQEFNVLNENVEYLNSLINEYWFLTDDIKNENIYYPLEGYLFPDTYNFAINATAKDVLKTILDNTKNKLDEYEDSIKNNDLSIHEIMTLASMVELEGKENSDRAGIARVFLNRIKSNMTLGSDVTTYYAARKTFKEDLTKTELNECNSYNTRGTCFIGLPVGPVSNPGLSAIASAINPEDNDYLYFVSDKDGKIYFSNTYVEHEKIVSNLKTSGNWYVYE